MKVLTWLKDRTEIIKDWVAILAIFAAGIWTVTFGDSYIGAALNNRKAALEIEKAALEMEELRYKLNQRSDIDMDMSVTAVGSTSKQGAYIVIGISIENIGRDPLVINMDQAKVVVRDLKLEEYDIVRTVPIIEYGTQIKPISSLYFEPRGSERIELITDIESSGVYSVVLEIPIPEVLGVEGFWAVRRFVEVE